jgi:hypothetical protein
MRWAGQSLCDRTSPIDPPSAMEAIGLTAVVLLAVDATDTDSRVAEMLQVREPLTETSPSGTGA